MFDTSTTVSPPQIYVSIDGGEPRLHRVDRDLVDFTPTPLTDSQHTADIVVKDIDEHENRWIVPMRSGLHFTGLQLAPGASLLPTTLPDALRLIFYGDSITQGVMALGAEATVDCADGTRSFAHLTGRAFQATTHQVGFGGQGILRPGNGGVGTAGQSLGWNFHGSSVDPQFQPHAVIVNQGTNDHAYEGAAFRPAYRTYLDRTRAAHPHAWLFAMSPFGGYHAEDIAWAVAQTRDARTVYVDTAGWLSPSQDDFNDGCHPNVRGHAKAARRLTAVIQATTGWTPVTDRSVELSGE
ncbi:GDSL-type esterase/lipase family protein [Streptomyces sp. NPDC001508]|uniref:GDSL-type esterase/lipase family protein n=1 Tax=Streptomyces sp. NPDC001508 TaxID=3154656 RepID=UPI00332BF0C1